MERRNVLVRETAGALCHPAHWKGLDSLDQGKRQQTTAEVQLHVHVLLAVAAHSAALNIRVLRPCLSGGVMLR